MLVNKDKKQIASERGKRVKLSRSLIGITRKEMTEKYGISVNTIQSWENGTNCLSQNGAAKLAEVFQKEGLNVTDEWLLCGDLSNSQASLTNNILSMRSDIKVLEEIDYFKNNNLNSVGAMVSDDGLLPIFDVGDYVGGISVSGKNIKDLVGEFCIITTSEGKILTRKILSYVKDDVFVISCINPFTKIQDPHFFSCSIYAAAPITRHWHTSKILRGI